MRWVPWIFFIFQNLFFFCSSKFLFCTTFSWISWILFCYTVGLYSFFNDISYLLRLILWRWLHNGGGGGGASSRIDWFGQILLRNNGRLGGLQLLILLLGLNGNRNQRAARLQTQILTRVLTLHLLLLLQRIENGLCLLGRGAGRHFDCMRGSHAGIGHVRTQRTGCEPLRRRRRHNLNVKRIIERWNLYVSSWFLIEWDGKITWMVWRAFGWDDTETGIILPTLLPRTIWLGCAWRITCWICWTVTVPGWRFFGFWTINWAVPTGEPFVTPETVPVTLPPALLVDIVLPVTCVICVILPAAFRCCCPIGICCNCIWRTEVDAFGNVPFNWPGLICAKVMPTVPPVAIVPPDVFTNVAMCCCPPTPGDCCNWMLGVNCDRICVFCCDPCWFCCCCCCCGDPCVACAWLIICRLTKSISVSVTERPICCLVPTCFMKWVRCCWPVPVIWTVATDATFVTMPGLPLTPDTVAIDTFWPPACCNCNVCPTFEPVTIPPWMIAPPGLTTLTWPPTVCRTVLPWPVFSTLNCWRDAFWRRIWNWADCPPIGLPAVVMAPIGMPPFVTTPDICWLPPIDRRNWPDWSWAWLTLWPVRPLTETTVGLCDPVRWLNTISCSAGAVTMRCGRNDDVVKVATAFDGRPDVIIAVVCVGVEGCCNKENRRLLMEIPLHYEVSTWTADSVEWPQRSICWTYL